MQDKHASFILMINIDKYDDYNVHHKTANKESPKVFSKSSNINKIISIIHKTKTIYSKLNDEWKRKELLREIVSHYMFTDL